MFRLFAGALLFTASSIFGISVKRVFRERYKLFVDLTDFTDYLEREIRCLKTPLTEIITNYETKKSLLTGILKKYHEGLRFGYNGVGDVAEKIKTVYLKSEDTQLIASFLYKIGKSDFTTELTNLERYRSVFAQKSAECEKDLKQNGDMYYKLAVTAGITAMLLVV